jgi:hypothetical protein
VGESVGVADGDSVGVVDGDSVGVAIGAPVPCGSTVISTGGNVSNLTGLDVGVYEGCAVG